MGCINLQLEKCPELKVERFWDKLDSEEYILGVQNTLDGDNEKEYTY